MHSFDKYLLTSYTVPSTIFGLWIKKAYKDKKTLLPYAVTCQEINKVE